MEGAGTWATRVATYATKYADLWQGHRGGERKLQQSKEKSWRDGTKERGDGFHSKNVTGGLKGLFERIVSVFDVELFPVVTEWNMNTLVVLVSVCKFSFAP